MLNEGPAMNTATLGPTTAPPGPDADLEAPPQQLRIKLHGPPGSLLDLMWVEFAAE